MKAAVVTKDKKVAIQDKIDTGINIILNKNDRKVYRGVNVPHITD